MMSIKWLVTALLIAGTSASGAAFRTAGADIAVVVNKSNPATSLSMTQLRKIVLAQDVKWPAGGKIIVWMTTPGQAERGSLLKIVCGMTETDYTLYFMHASFNGEGGDPPKSAGTGAKVRQSVAAAPNAVGFINAADVDDTVKVLAIDASRPGDPAYKLKLR